MDRCKPSYRHDSPKKEVEFSTNDDSPIRNIGYQFSNASTGEVSAIYAFCYAGHSSYIIHYLGPSDPRHILGSEDEVFDFDKQDIREFLKASGIILKECLEL